MGNEPSTEQPEITKELQSLIYNDNDAEFKITDEANENQKYEFSVCSFNLWCPFWNDSNGSEASDPDRWMKRHSDILHILSSSNDKADVNGEKKVNHNNKLNDVNAINADIYCMQEFWCAHRPFVNLYKNYLKQKNFALYHLKRSSGRKPDGIAIAFNKSVFKLINKIDIEYKSSNRVCIIMELQHVKSGLHISIGNTHFTFPNGYNRSSRKLLCTQFLEMMDKHTSNKTSLMILCGDYNCDIYETESILCLNKGYKSSFHIVNKNMEQNSVSHLTNKKQSVFVDHIFYKGNKNVDKDKKFGVKTMNSFMHPHNIATTKWPKEHEWNLSDHRPLVSTFQVQHY